MRDADTPEVLLAIRLKSLGLALVQPSSAVEMMLLSPVSLVLVTLAMYLGPNWVQDLDFQRACVLSTRHMGPM